MALGSLLPNCLSLLADWSPRSFSWSCTLKKLFSVMFFDLFSSVLLDLRTGDTSTILQESIVFVAVAGIVTGNQLLCSITGTRRPFSYLRGDLTWTAFLGDGRLPTYRPFNNFLEITYLVRNCFSVLMYVWLANIDQIRYFNGLAVHCLSQLCRGSHDRQRNPQR